MKELCEVVKVRMVSIKVMTYILYFEEVVLILICGYALQSD